MNTVSSRHDGAAGHDELPSLIGSYQILGPLAAGGMAEILLARRAGPSGFERLVVIKRVQPRFATDPDFVAMFLDEARIVSEIRHHNVIHVEDLGRDRDELFLVMEYLAGEAVSGLQRRCLMSGKPLSFALASFVVAEACAGLHAAHELVGANGTPRELVHRDISPQNIFVTYDGQVKVLDFGIAKSTERISPQTQVGTIKGKLEYMSPEQARGETLDRRSDIFSLGIVLCELATGHRLFKRFNPLQAIAAITTEPITPPSRVITGFPPALEKVCLKALARRVEDRYQTAAEMRRDLMRAMKDEALGLPDDPAMELAALMRRLFADRIVEKDELVRRARAGVSVEIPAVEVDITVELPSIAKEAPSSEPAIATANGDTEVASATTGPAGGTDAATRRSGRLTISIFAAVLVVMLLMGAGFALRSKMSSSQSTSSSPTTTATASEPAVAPTSLLPPAPSSAGAGSSTAPVSSAPIASGVTRRKVVVAPSKPTIATATTTTAATTATHEAPAPPPPPPPSTTAPFRRFQ